MSTVTTTKIESMLGKVIGTVTGKTGGDQLVFLTKDGNERFTFLHRQDCCESVTIEDINGEFDDLTTGDPLLVAEVSSSQAPTGEEPEYTESFTWTFYRFATQRGFLVVRWFGTSNGYYGEEVEMNHEILTPTKGWQFASAIKEEFASAIKEDPSLALDGPAIRAAAKAKSIEEQINLTKELRLLALAVQKGLKK